MQWKISNSGTSNLKTLPLMVYLVLYATLAVTKHKQLRALK